MCLGSNTLVDTGDQMVGKTVHAHSLHPTQQPPVHLWASDSVLLHLLGFVLVQCRNPPLPHWSLCSGSEQQLKVRAEEEPEGFVGCPTLW